MLKCAAINMGLPVFEDRMKTRVSAGGGQNHDNSRRQRRYTPSCTGPAVWITSSELGDIQPKAYWILLMVWVIRP